jgi:dihydroxyacetone kinase-like protein
VQARSQASCTEGLAIGEAIAGVKRAAEEGLAATRPLIATKGRASYLRERSIGHLDPGACSSCLLVHAACDVLLEATKP